MMAKVGWQAKLREQLEWQRLEICRQSAINIEKDKQIEGMKDTICVLQQTIRSCGEWVMASAHSIGDLSGIIKNREKL